MSRVDYQTAWDFQTEIHQSIIAQKRSRHTEDKPKHKPTVLLCEHDPVITLGKSGKLGHLLLSPAQLRDRGVDFFKINRGGDITYHGPGQLVVYPVLDLERFYRDVHRYVRELEEVIIRLLSTYDIEAQRHEGYTGVWLDGEVKRKVCAIGVHLSRWVSLHGLALNVNTNLSHFDYIVPCGIQEDSRAVTSISKEISAPVDMNDLKRRFVTCFQEVFQCQLKTMEPQ